MHSSPDFGKRVALYGRPFELSGSSVDTDCASDTDLKVSVGLMVYVVPLHVAVGSELIM